MKKNLSTGILSLSLFIMVPLICPLTLSAQSNFLSTKQAYLGQTPPDETPKIFAQGMLTDSGVVLGKVAFSRDGKSFFYSHSRNWFNNENSGTSEIKFDGKQWSKPQLIAARLTNPALSPDGSKIYLGGENSQVVVLDRSDTGWSTPKLFMQNEKYGLYNFQQATESVFYCGSNGLQGSKRDYSTYDFSRLRISGTDTIIESLGTTLNTPAFDGDFFIAPDESYIIISAKETPTYECELWISFKKPNGTWAKPQSLGPKINDGLAHRFGEYVSPDGKYLFYTRGTGEKDSNFYWVRFDRLLKKLKKKSR